MLSVTRDVEATQVTPGSHDLHSQEQPVPEENPHLSVDNFLPSQKQRQLYSRKFNVCVFVHGCACVCHVPNDILRTCPVQVL